MHPSIHFNAGKLRDSKHESGAALIVSLLLLLVMTILGVTALNSSVLQSFMSSSFQQQNTTLAGAENVLLAGEIDVEDVVLNGVAERAYFLDLTDDDVAPFIAEQSSPADWDIGALVQQTIGNHEITGRYILEYMGEFEVPGESIAAGGGLEDSRIHIFRVSARGGEANRGALRTVQSYYVTVRSPFPD